ncbi:hypothetical protein ACU21_07090 [Actinobaculum suis]|nr:hypothetical protein ACU20_02015 [Actinobaculum suis]OCA94461.1 hypothetical protein ACU21_07090 [Actinobaculum suis]
MRRRRTARDLNPRRAASRPRGSESPREPRERADTPRQHKSREPHKSRESYEHAAVPQSRAAVPQPHKGARQPCPAQGTAAHRPRKTDAHPVTPTAVTAPVVYEDSFFELADISPSEAAGELHQRRESPSGSGTRPPDLAERRRERRREKRRVVWRKTLGLGAVVGAGLFALWLIFFSPVFALHEDRISVSEVSAQAVVSDADIAELLNQFAGIPLTRLGLGKVTSTLQEEIPELASVNAHKEYPHGLSVELSWREAVACLGRGAECTPVDGQGEEMRVTEEARAALPRIGAATETNPAAVSTALEVLRGLDPDIRALVESTKLDNSGRVVLALTEGRTVVWGDASQGQEKLGVLRVLLGQPGTVFDISEPAAAVIK